MSHGVQRQAVVVFVDVHNKVEKNENINTVTEQTSGQKLNDYYDDYKTPFISNREPIQKTRGSKW